MSRFSLSSIVMPALAGVLAATALVPASAGAGGPQVRSAGELADLQVGTAGPFDGAWGAFQLVTTARGSHGLLRVRGIGSSAAGETFGAHLHVGPCVAGNGAAALGHYNVDVANDVPAAEVEISAHTEMWLDVIVDDGSATSTAHVPFAPVAGARSIVIHALPTDHHTGLAGVRLACLPVVW